MTVRRFSMLMVILLALAGAGAIVPAMAAPVDEAAAIRQVMAEQQTAWNHGDVSGYMGGYKDAPDTTFVGTGVRKGYQSILDSYRKHYANAQQMGRLTFSDLDVRLLRARSGEASFAVVTGRFHLDRSTHGEAARDDGVFSLLWEKTAGGWKIILDHTS